MSGDGAELDSTLLQESNDMNDIPVKTYMFFDVLLVIFILFSLLTNILGKRGGRGLELEGEGRNIIFHAGNHIFDFVMLQ